ncbi:MAG: conjugal transfer protein TraL [Desulfobulbus sp.]|nr:conjugal transfer protein TraL [Desulfobulbus sp.]
MKTIHLILQGKGGVGKSLVSSLLCQYLEKSGAVTAIDTDPVNNTLSGYEALNVTCLDIKKGDDIDRRKFDDLMEIILNEADENRQFVIDNGAATFLPLCAWMRENQTIEMWREAGVHVLLHSIITGGQGQDDTLDGLEVLMDYFVAPIVAWLNSYFGEISYKSKASGQTLTFEDFGLYKNNSAKFTALIRIPQKSAQTFGKDLEELFSRRQTFADAIADESMPIMSRQRLKIFWNEVCAEIDKANLILQPVDGGQP